MWNFRIPQIANFNSRKSKLKNKTKEFVKMLEEGERNIGKADFSYIICILGSRGSGKTHTECFVTYVTTTVNEFKPIDIWKSPGLYKALGKVFKNVKLVMNIGDIRPNSIVMFDEALILLNGKEALTTKLKEIGKTLAALRHAKVNVLICSQTIAFIKDLRDKIDLFIVKRITKSAAEDCFFLSKELQQKVTKLPKNKMIYYNQNPDNGLGEYGGLKIDLKDFPYWNDEISHNLSEGGLDFAKKQVMEEYEETAKYAKMMVEVFGNDVLKSKFLNKMKGYFLAHDLDAYSLLKSKFQDVADLAIYYIYQKKKDEKANNGEISAPNKKIVSGGTFADYCFHNTEGDELKKTIIKKFLEGITQEDISKQTSKQISKVNKLIKSFREKEMGNLFEDWFNLSFDTGYSAPHNAAEPDCIFPKNHALYPGEVFSLKCYCDRSNSITFYQSPPEDNKNFLKNFGPEYRYAKKNGMKYNAAILNPFWDNQVRIIKNIDPEIDDNKIIFFKSTETLDIPIKEIKIDKEEPKDKKESETMTLGDYYSNLTGKSQEVLMDEMVKEMEERQRQFREDFGFMQLKEGDLDEVDEEIEDIEFEEEEEVIENEN